MTVKTYKAIDMQEALKMIKRDLGPQAVIISTRKVMEGKKAFGLLGRPMVEVTAAVDIASPQETSAQQDGARQAENGHKVLESLRCELNELRKEVERIFRSVQDPAKQLSARLEAELDEMRWWASRMVRQSASNKEGLAAIFGSPVLYRLTKHGVKETHAIQILSRVEELLGDQTSEELFLRKVEEMLLRVSKTVDPLHDTETVKPRVIAFVGPTGVGKTTTVAKLAARCTLEQGKRVALLTNDTYRIAAVEQLKTYARIMGVPLEVVLTPEEISQVIDSHSDRDVIFIDTAGRSPMDEGQVAELESLLTTDSRIKTVLLLAAPTEPIALERAARRFMPLNPVALIGTKLDEASHLGSLFSVSVQMRLPFAFFTMGQRVPEDIRVARKEDIASWVLWGLPLFYAEPQMTVASG
jgi:flagellar biosynthesis protein FlhF